MEISEKYSDRTENYFRSQDWILPNWKVIKYSKAGEGNMNLVMRVQTNFGNIIVKQSRPYVEKYKQVPAPVERIAVEHAFYVAIADNETLASYSPRIIGYDPRFYTMIMEDLGFGTDYLGLYAGTAKITKNDLAALMKYLSELHQLRPKSFPSNDKMKALNHEHIFNYPFLTDNGFDLDSVQKGLEKLAEPFKKNEALKTKIEELGKQYLGSGNTLLHGDFYPGSWLKVESELKVIDPEFAFMGDAAFDLGVMLAHLKLGGVEEELITFALKAYTGSIDEELLKKYMAVEVLRRLFGLAQLPLTMSLEKKKVLAEEAAKNIVTN